MRTKNGPAEAGPLEPHDTPINPVREGLTEIMNLTDRIDNGDRVQRRGPAAELRPTTHPDEARLSLVATVALSVLALVGGYGLAEAVNV